MCFFLKIFLRKSKRGFHSSFQVSSILKKELSQKAKIHLHFSKIWSEKQKISSLKKNTCHRLACGLHSLHVEFGSTGSCLDSIFSNNLFYHIYFYVVF